MRSFLRSESGAAAVYIALVSPILIGFAALGSEVGMWLLTQRKIQHIADVAAYTAATRSLSTDDIGKVRESVMDRASGAGLLADDDLVLTLPPTTGSYAGRKNHAEVTVSRALPRYLTALFSTTGAADDVLITARAVAGVDPESGEQACMVALGKTGVTLSIGGSGEVTMVNCAAGSNSVASNSAQRVGNNAELTATCVYTVGGTDNLQEDNVKITYTDPECASPRTRQRPSADPYADLAMLTSSEVAGINAVSPTPDPVNADGVVYAARQSISSLGELKIARFDDLNLKGEVRFEPGLYIIDGARNGDLTINAEAVVEGENVSFYLMNGATLSVSGSAQVKLTAYNKATSNRTDPYNGILFFGDRVGTELKHSFTGNNGTVLSGLIYFPNDEVEFSGNTNRDVVEPCIRLLSGRITISGNSTVELDDSCDFRSAMPPNAPKITAQQRISLKE